MANEIGLSQPSGETIYMLVLNSVNQVWNTGTSAFETALTANWTNYAIAMTESDTGSGLYRGSFPTAIPAGTYGVEAYKQAGGSAASSDGPAIANIPAYVWPGVVPSPTPTPTPSPTTTTCSDNSIAAQAALLDAISSPRRVSSDAGSVEQHSLPDLIAAAKYAAAICAANSRSRGLRFNQLIPGGTTSRRVRHGGDGCDDGFRRGCGC